MADTYRCSEVINTCVYSCNLNSCDRHKICNYLSIANHSRGCDPEECDKYMKKTDANIRMLGLEHGGFSREELNLETWKGEDEYYGK